MMIYIVFAVIALLYYVRYRQTYWKRRGLYQFKPEYFFGNARKELFGLGSIFLLFRDTYEKARALKEKHFGIYFFWDPLYVPTDLNIIKHILIKDFQHFHGHGWFSHPKDRLSMNLFAMEGEPWRVLRAKLTPTFTSGRMKMMFDTLVAKTEGLERIVEGSMARGKPVDIKETASRFTTDIIASCAFGIENDALGDDRNDFRRQGRKMFKPNVIYMLLFNTLPSWILGPLGFKFAPKDLDKFFSETVLDTIEYREKYEVRRKDFMDLLLQLKNGSDDGKQPPESQRITVDEIIAQCFVFFLAGFETSSTTITFALLELAFSQDIQEKLRNEILDVLERYDGLLSYDAMMEMTYLDMVVSETLRKYPPGGNLPRVCSKTYRVPGTDVVIEKGTKVQIPVWGIQMDPEYYPDPETFDPERFTADNKAKRPEMTFLPFGEGPRMCIGLRFGTMQVKVGLISLLKKFKFTLNEKTRTPIEMEKVNFVLAVEGDVWLNASRV
ncbi:putative cytochrome P450 6a20 isoform X2 [Rhynchophorus ferrugineus]|uniref:putative cytochrome P450 6a20 isoform X2 n=1 Tax=Rhynchophorus ferrugineus TaxID=354439 RepID=UPI003FCD6C7C